MATNTQQGLPGVPGIAMVGPDGIPTQGWYSFFLNLWQRTGGASGGASAILDQITNVVGSMLYRATNGWAGLAPNTQYKVLRMGASVPEWDVLDGNSFGSQTANEVFASPNGISGVPSFRAVLGADFGSQSANEVLASPNGSSGSPTFRGIVGADFGSQTENEFLASPNGSSGNPTFRTIATADLESTAGQYPGTDTNDNASAGNIGEYVSSTVAQGSAVPISPSTTIVDVTSILLTAGDWDVSGIAAFHQTGNTSVIVAGVSSTPVTFQAFASVVFAYTTAGTPPVDLTLTVPPIRFSLSTTTTVYLVAQTVFSSGASGAYGIIQARRAR